MDLMTGWLGPLGLLAALGVGTSIYRRPRYILLSGLALIVTCIFAASLRQRGHRALLPASR